MAVTRRKLLRLVDVAELLGVSKQRADQLRRQPDFPVPVDRWARGDLWAASDVRRWASTYAEGSRRWGLGFSRSLTLQRLGKILEAESEKADCLGDVGGRNLLRHVELH